jgi:acetylglutamate kinase
LRITVKLGGSILEDGRIRGSILGQIEELYCGGHEVILVHGGGKSLNRRLLQLGMQSRFIQGLRVTDDETLAVAIMVLAGEVNKRLVLELGALKTRAAGFCGADAMAVTCSRISDGAKFSAELGFVGKPLGIDRGFFDMLLRASIIPVIASIAAGPDAQAYNVNADQMASVCAWGSGSAALIYLTDVAGVMDKSGNVISRLNRGDIEKLRDGGVVAGGMLPKTEACLEALEKGVPDVYIVPGMSEGILGKLVAGTLKEGTCIHGNSIN